MLSNPTFKFEILNFKGQDFDSDNVIKAFKIFETSAISFTKKSPRKSDFYQKFYEILPKISEGSVHILDWIISFFKAYSGYMKFGEAKENSIDLEEDPEEITLRTKMKVRQELKRKKKPSLKRKQTPVKIPNEPKFLSPEGRADKEYYKITDDKTEDENNTQIASHNQSVNKVLNKPNIGVFLQNKQMMFGEDSLVPEEGQKVSLVDYNAFKRGTSFLIDEEEEMRKREKEEQEKEDKKKMLMEKNSKFKVDNLPNKTEHMLETLKDIDYEEQPLETLIALAEKLKQKRMEMFPDTQSI